MSQEYVKGEMFDLCKIVSLDEAIRQNNESLVWRVARSRIATINEDRSQKGEKRMTQKEEDAELADVENQYRNNINEFVGAEIRNDGILPFPEEGKAWEWMDIKKWYMKNAYKIPGFWVRRADGLVEISKDADKRHMFAIKTRKIKAHQARMKLLKIIKEAYLNQADLDKMKQEELRYVQVKLDLHKSTISTLQKELEAGI